jgi:hypothetical protein
LVLKNRANHDAVVILEGQALKDITFSNGLAVKKGTYLSMCGGAILKNSDPPVQLEGAIERRPVTDFDAFRFAVPEEKVASNSEDSDPSHPKRDSIGNTNLATSISPGNLTFGYGRMSCPGRYFAVHSIKAIVVSLLMQYEVEMESAKGPGLQRPDNIQAGNVIIPNPSVVVRYRAKT